MNNRQTTLLTPAVTLLAAMQLTHVHAQVYDTSVNLLQNGSFEIASGSGATLNVPGWIDGPNSFELIAHGDDGSAGVKSVGFTTGVTSDQNDPATWADWLSRPITVIPGETLLWRFRYKMTNSAATPQGEILADSRTFASVDPASNPVDYQGTGGNFILGTTGGAWESREMAIIVPPTATALDLRVNQIFTFFTTLPWQGAFRMDDMSLHRVLNLRADFDANSYVGAPDLAIWKTNFATLTGATKPIGDADNDADVDGADLLIWQQEVGKGVPPPIAAVPEPHGLALALAGPIALALACVKMRRNVMLCDV